MTNTFNSKGQARRWMTARSSKNRTLRTSWKCTDHQSHLKPIASGRSGKKSTLVQPLIWTKSCSERQIRISQWQISRINKAVTTLRAPILQQINQHFSIIPPKSCRIADWSYPPRKASPQPAWLTKNSCLTHVTFSPAQQIIAAKTTQSSE